MTTTEHRFNRLPIGVEALDLSGSVWQVYIALISHANWSTKRTRLYRKTIAEQTGVAVETVSRAIGTLVEHGLIEATQTGRSSMFRIIYEPVEKLQNGHTRSDETVTSTERDVLNEKKNLSPTKSADSAQPQSDVQNVQSSGERRAEMSRRATTPNPITLTREFRPSLVGYTGDDFRADYPDVDPVEVLNSFFSHHIGKGDTSKNWLERFWSYAAKAQQIEAERKREKPNEIDSTGMPTDPVKRREMTGHTQDPRERAFANAWTRINRTLQDCAFDQAGNLIDQAAFEHHMMWCNKVGSTLPMALSRFIQGGLDRDPNEYLNAADRAVREAERGQSDG